MQKYRQQSYSNRPKKKPCTYKICRRGIIGKKKKFLRNKINMYLNWRIIKEPISPAMFRSMTILIKKRRELKNKLRKTTFYKYDLARCKIEGERDALKCAISIIRGCDGYEYLKNRITYNLNDSINSLSKYKNSYRYKYSGLDWLNSGTSGCIKGYRFVLEILDRQGELF